MVAMKLKQWRLTQEKTLLECAKDLGLRDGRTFQRYETGENRPDAPLADAIILMTKGQVTLEDLHIQRLEWLESQKAVHGELLEVEAAE